MGDDLSRSLLLFGESKPLGERGLRWLKIHLSNLYGFDKATFDERVDFVHKHLDDILDSAENPINVSFPLPRVVQRLSHHRDVNGGRKPMTHGSVWQPA
jgi:DNA-dependent RNA polymerase